MLSFKTLGFVLLVLTAICNGIDIYDNIIIGGGPGAAPIVLRLAQQFPNRKILMLVDGYNETGINVSVEPKFWNVGTFSPGGEHSIFKKYVNNEDARRYNYATKVLGGGSAVNSQLYVRASRSDLDAWGVPGWSYDDLEPFMNRVENYLGSNSTGRGTSGPITVIQPPVVASHTSALRDALQNVLGLDYNEDYNTGNLFGVSTMQRNSKVASSINPTREYVANTYLADPAVKNNPHVTISYGSTATRLILQRNVFPWITNDWIVIGVEYLQEGQTKYAFASHKVISAAGVYGTPKLLQLSGIGGASVLANAGIPLKVDQPLVGQMMEEEFGLPLLFGGPAVDFTQDDSVTLVAFANTGLGSTPSHLVDSEYYGISGNVPGYANFYFIQAVLLRPKFRGEIHMLNKDPLSDFTFNIYPLSEPEDVVRLRHIFRTARQWIANSTYPLVEQFPGYESVPEDATDDQIDAFISASGFLYNHALGTCRIGNSKTDGVVDSRLHAFGLDNLMIADASALRKVSAHPMATIYGLGERAADILIQEINNNKRNGIVREQDMLSLISSYVCENNIL